MGVQNPSGTVRRDPKILVADVARRSIDIRYFDGIGKVLGTKIGTRRVMQNTKDIIPFPLGLLELVFGPFLDRFTDIAYREDSSPDEFDSFDVEEIDEEILAGYYMEMERDYVFIDEMKKDEVILHSSKDYDQWKLLRNEYERRRYRII